MSRSEIILEYRGPVDLGVIESLLLKLKQVKEYSDLDITTRRRVYAIVVECLENISKNDKKLASDNIKMQPHLSVTRENDQVIISAGNSVNKHTIDKLAPMLDQVNQLDEVALRTFYEHKISMETVPQENSAGLGFLTMRIKAGSKIEYSFTDIDKEIAYFRIRIPINKYTMRKLIIEQTTNSPKVLLDPDNSFFKISGESRPPDVTAFYTEILNWFDDYSSHLGRSKESPKPVTFDFDFEYFNSSSAKYLLDFCKQIASARSKGIDIAVRWHFEENDIDMLQAGKEMSRIVKFPFEYIQKNLS
jgi:hypothetical protein